MKSTLTSTSKSHKRSSALKTFGGTDSDGHALLRSNDSLACDSKEKSNLLFDNFAAKESSAGINLPLTCHPVPPFTSFAFKSNGLKRYINELDSYGSVDSHDALSLFLRKV